MRALEQKRPPELQDKATKRSEKMALTVNAEKPQDQMQPSATTHGARQPPSKYTRAAPAHQAQANVKACQQAQAPITNKEQGISGYLKEIYSER